MDSLAVTGWSVASPLGLGAEAFADGLRQRRRGVGPLDPERWPGPVREAGVVDGFTPAGALGRRGTRSMDRATGLAVATVGMLLDGTATDGPGGDVGLVLGTGTGSVASMMGFTRDSLTQDKPYYVDPARFPNTVMNCAAGQCAIWHGLKGPNTTIAGGHLTGLLALRYAARLERCGHADMVLCGAVEEFSVERAWLEWTAPDPEGPGEPPGEGCAVLRLESAATARRGGRAVLADVLAVEVGAFGDEATPREVLAGCLHRALDAADVGADDVWAVAPSGSRGARGDAERAALRDVLGDAPRTTVACADLLGDTAAASGAFQLAAVLAASAEAPQARGRVAAVTSLDRDGLVGCALVRGR